jgi:hypothetical protein
MISRMKKATKPTKTLESIKETGTIDISDPNVADEFARFMKETDPKGSKTIEQTVELSNFDPKGRKKNATGGRAGYGLGSLVSQARQDSDGIEARLEQLGGDVTSAEQLLQQINERLESAGSSIPEGGAMQQPVGSGFTQPAAPAGGLGSLAGPNVGNEIAVPTVPGTTPTAGTPLPSDKNFFMNNISDMDGLKAAYARAQKSAHESRKTMPNAQVVLPGEMTFEAFSSGFNPSNPSGLLGGGIQPAMGGREAPPPNRYASFEDMMKSRIQADVPDSFTNLEGVRSNPDGTPYTGAGSRQLPASLTMASQPNSLQKASSQQNLQTALPGLFAQGGRAGFYTGGMTDVKPDLSDIGHGSDSLMSRTRVMSPGSQATTSTGLNYLLAEDNDNIRVPFSKGKIAKDILDKGRRGFMKAAGAGAAGLAALKTGLLGFGEKAAPVVQATKETVQQVPTYFFDLVAKIKMFGKEGTPLSERMNVTNYKNFELTEDIATGDMRITKQVGDPEVNYKEEVMEYNKGGNPMEEGITKESYEEATLFPDMDGKLKDIEDGIDESSIQEIIEEVSEKVTKKASGGIARMIGE